MEVKVDTVQELKNINESMAIWKNEYDIMGKHIVIQLRELPPYDRVLANFDLQKVLMDYRLRNMSRTSLTTSFSRPNSAAASSIQSTYTLQTTASEESTTANIIHSTKVNTMVKCC